MTGECRFFLEQYLRKDNKSNGKEDDQKKEEGDQGDHRFQKPKGTVTVIFSRVPGSRSKHQDKLALRTIIAAEPVTPSPGTSIGHNIRSNSQGRINRLVSETLGIIHWFWIQLLLA